MLIRVQTGRLAGVLLFLVGSIGTTATTAEQLAPDDSLFSSNEVITVRLEGPLGDLVAGKKSGEDVPISVTVGGVTRQIQVSPRGRSRLKVCEFPPLTLDFSGADMAGTPFSGQGSLRLVTHCRNNDRGEQDMLEEYAAYRIFNLLAEEGYRVRLLRIEYQDSTQRLPESAGSRFGFLIESREQLALRIGATPVSLAGVPAARHDAELAALVYIFHYLIANTDWGFVRSEFEAECCHNGNTFERDGLVLVVPYDFDLAGLVNPPYAVPDRSLRIRRVTQRLYRGLCTERHALRSALGRVLEKKSEVLAVPASVPGLSARNVRRDRRFLEGFYQRAEREEKMLEYFEKRCI